MSNELDVRRFHDMLDKRPRPGTDATVAEIAADIERISEMALALHKSHLVLHPGCERRRCTRCGCQCAFHEIGGRCLGRRGNAVGRTAFGYGYAFIAPDQLGKFEGRVSHESVKWIGCSCPGMM